MKIIFQCRPNLYQLSGGDKIQILKTKEYLEKAGVEVRISITERPDLRGVDILHLFNPSLLSIKPITDCRQKGIPVAISTIHWDMKEYYKSIFTINKEYLKLKPQGYIPYYLRNQAFAFFYNYWWYGKSMRNLKKYLSWEMRFCRIRTQRKNFLKNNLDFRVKKFFIIPNGIDPYTTYSSSIFYRKYKMSDFILCAARLEYRKNQFHFLQSMMKNNLPIVFIGNNQFNRGIRRFVKNLRILAEMFYSLTI